jgi:N-acetyl sugar amidotransferase
MRYCRRCLYPENHPFGIGFDAQGICTGCRVHEEKDKLDWVAREKKLATLLAGYRGQGRARHDCVVPVSGGRDSFFIVHLLRKVYGLNPLLVAYNRHYNSRAGIFNIAHLRTVLGCDIHTLTLDPRQVKRVMRTTLDRIGSFHWHALAGQSAFPVQTAVRAGIPLVIWGAHQALDQVGMFSHLDEVEMSRRYRREHDLMGLEAEDLMDEGDLSPADLEPFFYPQDADLRRVGVRGIYLGNYIRWDSKVQHEKMVKLYDYYMGPLARTFDSYNDVDDLHYAGAHDLIKMAKLGYGKATDHASREIRFGRLTRAQGAELATIYEQAPAGDLSRLAAFMQISESDVLGAADRFRDLRIWEKTAGDWKKKDAAAQHPGGADLPKTGPCEFRSNTPEVLDGDPYAGQLLTKGYMRETV